MNDEGPDTFAAALAVVVFALLVVLLVLAADGLAIEDLIHF